MEKWGLHEFLLYIPPFKKSILHIKTLEIISSLRWCIWGCTNPNLHPSSAWQWLVKESAFIGMRCLKTLRKTSPVPAQAGENNKILSSTGSLKNGLGITSESSCQGFYGLLFHSSAEEPLSKLSSEKLQ